MASLTKVAIFTKRFMVLAAVLGVALLGAAIGYQSVASFLKKVNPPKPPPPTVAFGKLPPLDFGSVKTITKSTGLNFKVDTIEGGIPTLPDRVTVFPVKKETVSLLSLDKASNKVKKIGLQSQPEALTETLYKWRDLNLPSRQIVLDIVSQNFEFSYDYTFDAEILQKKGIVDLREAKKIATKFLNTLEINLGNFDNEKTSTIILELTGGKLTEVQSLAEAEMVRVNFHRPDLEGLPFVSPYPDKATVSVLVAPFSLSDNKKQIAEANYTYWQPDTTKSATYPTKTAVEAFNELKSGEGYVLAKFNPDSNVTLRRIYLAYIELPVTFQPYLQPVVVFEGDHGFRAVVPAVRADYWENLSPSPTQPKD